ncbi:hypothetical protein OEG84_04740 [Hoeflea sp. G2-23]|uniref:Uncharacterized protein n=1 Tax=Hoeflea algicola TaxID=2983763 RepID=A0ABT3Z5J6_9HYPH|nr:hypothetical protein [Hoeflea algicola]MCY0147043.1 hypothetical protein [Hoeflea algicola]
MTVATKPKPELLKLYKAPWHVSMDGIRDDNGVWIAAVANPDMQYQLVELANYAAGVAGISSHAKAPSVTTKAEGA